MKILKDLVLRYCVIFGKRFSAKQKIAFLRVISKELIQLGYMVDAKLAKLKLATRRYENYYNAYIGDLNKAELIICTYYDTGVNNFNIQKKYAFSPQFSKLSYFISIAPIIILFIASLILNYFVLIPDIRTQGFFSVSGVGSIISTVLLFFFVFKFKSGIPNQKNFVCNSSSIITIINLINKLNKKEKKKIAFVLYDGGNSNQYGLKMLESYSNQMKDKKFIFIDSIGNGNELIFLKPQQSNLQLEDITFYSGKMETQIPNYIMITSGDIDENGKIVIKNAHSAKDNYLSDKVINKHTQSLLEISRSLISTNNDK
ncbi:MULTISPECIES: hypothetical protein [unclassified Gilliamella]|uniref:hypothetical protein n=1 Tax=unclassified Gilliamella TaxID=2685620 RepID=UPI00130AA553|nr:MULTISPECIES: hypothetical protein [unclassified Gilliamella]MWP49176.1 hypothetical protein [Gilliamella sp. Lep-s35]MWP68055.1 hypothetical protein [Gilliamella sp. Lep-s5]MWP76275.1 hypothetical protein [Gilliamella sp. Lep-s21]